MSILVVGSVALDTVKTPFGQADDVLGGSAVFFSAAASLFSPVSVVAVVGDDYPVERLGFLEGRGVDLAGLGYALRASSGSLSVGSGSFDVGSAFHNGVPPGISGER